MNINSDELDNRKQRIKVIKRNISLYKLGIGNSLPVTEILMKFKNLDRTTCFKTGKVEYKTKDNITLMTLVGTYLYIPEEIYDDIENTQTPGEEYPTGTLLNWFINIEYNIGVFLILKKTYT